MCSFRSRLWTENEEGFIYTHPPPNFGIGGSAPYAPRRARGKCPQLHRRGRRPRRPCGWMISVPTKAGRAPAPALRVAGLPGCARYWKRPGPARAPAPTTKTGTSRLGLPRSDTAPARRLTVGGQRVLRPPKSGSRRDRAASAYEAPDSEAGKPQVLRRRGFSRTMGP